MIRKSGYRPRMTVSFHEDGAARMTVLPALPKFSAATARVPDGTPLPPSPLWGADVRARTGPFRGRQEDPPEPPAASATCSIPTPATYSCGCRSPAAPRWPTRSPIPDSRADTPSDTSFGDQQCEISRMDQATGDARSAQLDPHWSFCPFRHVGGAPGPKVTGVGARPTTLRALGDRLTVSSRMPSTPRSARELWTNPDRLYGRAVRTSCPAQLSIVVTFGPGTVRS